MELAKLSLTFFNKTLCISGRPAAPALFPLAPREERTEPKSIARSLRLCPFLATPIGGSVPPTGPGAPPILSLDKTSLGLPHLAVGTGLEWGCLAPHGSGCCCCWGCCSLLPPPSGSSMCSSPRKPRPRLNSVTTQGLSSSVSPH